MLSRTLLAATVLLLAGCAQAPEPLADSTPAHASAGSPDCTPAMPQRDPTWLAEKPVVEFETNLGRILIEVEMEAAPITGSNFLNLTRSGTYDGTLFHRVVPGFVIQGGDPLSKDDDPNNDGTGDAGYEIPDELHPELRHSGPGILSMANSGPDTGGSQFFITLSATPHLDDRHSVFGRVIEGIEVVQAIGTTQVDGQDRPVEDITLERAKIRAPSEFVDQSEVDAHVIVANKKGEPGRPVRFAALAQNGGTTRDAIAVVPGPPAGWTCTTDAPAVVPAGTGRVVFFTLTPPAGATGTIEIPYFAVGASGAKSSGNDKVAIEITKLGPQVRAGDKVTANYAGVLLDGRLFDTSLADLARNPDQPKFETTGGFQVRPSYSTFGFTVGGGVIAGFTELAKTAKVGETVTAAIAPRDAYATGNAYERPLTGRALVFELEIIKVE